MSVPLAHDDFLVHDDVRRPGALGLPVPPAGPDVCRRCRGPVRHWAAECFCCSVVGRLLGQRPGQGPVVVPVAACRPGDGLHSALRRYKDAPSVAARRHYVALLAERMEQFLSAHLGCLWSATGGWDALAVVPSSTRAPVGRSAVHPLEAVLCRVPSLAGTPLLALARGTAAVGHLAPDRGAFLAPSAMGGRRVLVVDDTWVTGATARSAAACLAGSGMTVPGVLVLGRAVEPGAHRTASGWWQNCRQLAGQGFESCCLAGCRRAEAATCTM
ncbi:MAG TPA: hypothetical protein VEJ21_02895 [Acidimicrobiales bacterium]|nr:hypothetical protein [Acidimicrobiales bacterium]